MNKSKLNIEMINSRISLIKDNLNKLHELENLTKEDFFKDYRNYNTAENLLRQSLEAIFDIGRHILAKINGLSVDFEYKIIAKKLIEKEIITSSLQESLINMAGYRNRLIHFYHDILVDEIYDILHKHLNDIEKFVKEIIIFIS
jgi:uncharacterized protein YutE (UPF0331/DUF86 family)